MKRQRTKLLNILSCCAIAPLLIIVLFTIITPSVSSTVILITESNTEVCIGAVHPNDYPDDDDVDDDDDDDTIEDADGDGIPDTDDICAGHDDNIDTDNDGTPDGCDDTPNGEEPDDDDTDDDDTNDDVDDDKGDDEEKEETTQTNIPTTGEKGKGGNSFINCKTTRDIVSTNNISNISGDIFIIVIV